MWERFWWRWGKELKLAAFVGASYYLANRAADRGRDGLIAFSLWYPILVAYLVAHPVMHEIRVRGRKPERRSCVRWEIQIGLHDVLKHPWMKPALDRMVELGRTSDPDGLARGLRFLLHDGMVWSDHHKTYRFDMTTVGRPFGEALGADRNSGDTLLEPEIVVHDGWEFLSVYLVRVSLDQPWERLYPRAGAGSLIRELDSGRPELSASTYQLLGRLPLRAMAHWCGRSS